MLVTQNGMSLKESLNIERGDVERIGKHILQKLFPKRWQTFYNLVNEAEDRLRQRDFRDF